MILLSNYVFDLVSTALTIALIGPHFFGGQDAESGLAAYLSFAKSPCLHEIKEVAMISLPCSGLHDQPFG